MKPLTAIGLATVGGVVAFRCLPRDARDRITARARRRMAERMERMMASLPEGSPPKLVMTVLPKLQAQNDQIIAMLREQNELLQQQRLPADVNTIRAERQPAPASGLDAPAAFEM